jgi:hypothetical protein
LENTYFKNKLKVQVEVICTEARRQCDSLLEDNFVHEMFEMYNTTLMIRNNDLPSLTYGDLIQMVRQVEYFRENAYHESFTVVKIASGFHFYEIRPRLEWDENQLLNVECPPGCDYLFDKTLGEIKHTVVNHSSHDIRFPVMVFACNADDGILL